VANAFRPMAPAPHRPRVTIDTFVLARESWTFGATGTTWAFHKDERTRLALARAWRREHGLPERCFVSTPAEQKPVAVDFSSVTLVNILAKSVRRTAEDGGAFSLSEMLPDIGELWLPDARDRRYTSELRIVAIDRHDIDRHDVRLARR
jgi:hypothetical protein